MKPKNTLDFYYLGSKFNKLQFPSLDICFLSNNIMDYHVVSQGKTTIPNVDDGEEMTLTDVRHQSILKCPSVVRVF